LGPSLKRKWELPCLKESVGSSSFLSKDLKSLEDEVHLLFAPLEFHILRALRPGQMNLRGKLLSRPTSKVGGAILPGALKRTIAKGPGKTGHIAMVSSFLGWPSKFFQLSVPGSMVRQQSKAVASNLCL
jgi:hypothetical protein